MKKKIVCIILFLLLINGCTYNTYEHNITDNDSNTAQLETSSSQPIPTQPLSTSTPQPLTESLPLQTQALMTEPPPLPTQPHLLEPLPSDPQPPTVQFVPSVYAAHSIEIAEAFLSQYLSMFFYVVNYNISNSINEPVIIYHRQNTIDDDGRHGWEPYFTDFDGYIIENAPFIQRLYGVFSGDLKKPAFVYAGAFQLYTIEDSDIPLLIIMRFYSVQFTGGAHVIFELSNNGTEFQQLGSMTPWWSGGGDIPVLSPFINESGEIINYMVEIGWGILYQLNNEGHFESTALFEPTLVPMESGHGSLLMAVPMEEFAKMLSNYEKKQNAVTNYHTLLTDLYNKNFVPMVRMYDLENYLYEKIRQQLRGMFPVVDVNQIDE